MIYKVEVEIVPHLQIIDTGMGMPFVISFKKTVLKKEYDNLSSAKKYFTRRKNRMKEGIIVRLKEGNIILKETDDAFKSISIRHEKIC